MVGGCDRSSLQALALRVQCTEPHRPRPSNTALVREKKIIKKKSVFNFENNCVCQNAVNEPQGCGAARNAERAGTCPARAALVTRGWRRNRGPWAGHLHVDGCGAGC